MKKLFLLTTAALLLGAVACNKTNVPSSGTAVHSSPTGRVRLEIASSPQSKAAYNERKDFQINSVQVFVFNSSDGKKETDRYEKLATPATSSTSLTLNTLTGNKIIYAVVNSPRLNGVSSLTALEGTLSDLKENTISSLVMSGKSTLAVTEYDINKNSNAVAQTLEIKVKRLASLILLDQVKVNFNGTALEEGSFSIEEIYLKNVVGKCPLGVDDEGTPVLLSDTDHANTAYWYNKLTKTDGCPELTFDVFNLPCNTAGTATQVSRFLLAYPNKTVDDTSSGSFSQRHTRLVIKAKVKASKYIDPDVDELTYYTFDLPVLKSNTVYKITNINITMLGKKDDSNDDKTLVGVLNPTIKVEEWNEPVQIQYEM